MHACSCICACVPVRMCRRVYARVYVCRLYCTRVCCGDKIQESDMKCCRFESAPKRSIKRR